MGLKHQAAECQRLSLEGLHAPSAWGKRRIVRPNTSDRVLWVDWRYKEGGNAAPSIAMDAITRYHLDDSSKSPELVQAIKRSAVSLYGGDYHPLLSQRACGLFI